MSLVECELPRCLWGQQPVDRVGELGNAGVDLAPATDGGDQASSVLAPRRWASVLNPVVVWSGIAG